jgi:hypothetical protein
MGSSWQHTADFVIEVSGYWQTYQRISDQYFQGQSPLFPDLEVALAALVEQSESVSTMFNDHLDFQQHLRGKRKRKDSVPPPPLDLDDLRRRASRAASRRSAGGDGASRSQHDDGRAECRL